jgi:chemosensory pili system protein ChpA (sensor histidine kinase/response regulator)
MVLVLIDDLLFRSKISSAAKAAGVELAVVGSPEAALERARGTTPSAIVVDLDSQRTRPLDLLRQLSADPALASIPTLGFVSHVRADAIRDARSAGIGDVLARGAFAANLPDLLRRFETGSPGRQ